MGLASVQVQRYCRNRNLNHDQCNEHDLPRTEIEQTLGKVCK